MKKNGYSFSRSICLSVRIVMLVILFTVLAPTAANAADRETHNYDDLRIYQIMVASFNDGDSSIGYDSIWGSATLQNPGGDIQGIIDALDYIKGTGVNAIWLTPVFTSEGSEETADGTDAISDDPTGNKLNATGYYTTDYFRIDPQFGDSDKLCELVSKAHKKGMYVFLDAVFGHCSANVNTVSPKGNKLVLRKGSNEFTNDAGGGNIDVGESIDFLKEVALYWIDTADIDGFRCDQAYQLSREQWGDIRSAVEERCGEREKEGKKWGILGYMVAEDWNTDRKKIVSDVYGSEGNIGLYSAFSFPVQQSFERVFAENASPSAFYRAYKADAANYPAYASPNLFIDNHDMERFGDLLTDKGILYGSEDYLNRYKEAISLLAVYRGPVTMFYNTEIGAACHEECPDYLKGKTGGAGNDSGRFNAVTDLSELTYWERELYDYTGKVMALKDRYPVICSGNYKALISDKESQIYAAKMSDKKDCIVYILNNSDKSDAVIDAADVGADKLADVVTGRLFRAKDGKFNIEMHKDSARFLVKWCK